MSFFINQFVFLCIYVSISLSKIGGTNKQFLDEINYLACLISFINDLAILRKKKNLLYVKLKLSVCRLTCINGYISIQSTLNLSQTCIYIVIFERILFMHAS